MPGMKIWDEKFADEIDDDKFYFHLLIFHPQICHIFFKTPCYFFEKVYGQRTLHLAKILIFSPRQSCSIGRPAGKKDKKSMA